MHRRLTSAFGGVHLVDHGRVVNNQGTRVRGGCEPANDGLFAVVEAVGLVHGLVVINVDGEHVFLQALLEGHNKGLSHLMWDMDQHVLVNSGVQIGEEMEILT